MSEKPTCEELEQRVRELDAASADRKTFAEIDRNRDGLLGHEEYHRSLGHGSS